MKKVTKYNTVLTLEDFEVLTSALRSQIVVLTKSGDYPEKARDRKLMDKLIYNMYNLKKKAKQEYIEEMPRCK